MEADGLGLRTAVGIPSSQSTCPRTTSLPGTKARKASGNFRESGGAGVGVPPIKTVFSRCRATVQHGAVQRQETQIVQSWLTLRDFLP